MSISFTKAQVDITKARIFKVQYSKARTWNVQCSPVNIVAGQDLTLSGFKGALDASGASIDWGTGRYLMFVAKLDGTKGANSLADDINEVGTKYIISLELYESNGTLVKVVSNWGNLKGKGDKGFIYEAEGKFGMFFSNTDLTSTAALKYKPNLAKLTLMSEIIGFKLSGVMDEGTVMMYNAAKGFGLITIEAEGVDIFFSRAELFDEVRTNDKVTFDYGKNKKGLIAVKIKLH
jgi:cold shock CspA family protein